MDAISRGGLRPRGLLKGLRFLSYFSLGCGTYCRTVAVSERHSGIDNI